VEISNQIASDITAYCKYAKFLPEDNRRETWEETVFRTEKMHQARYASCGITHVVSSAFKGVYKKENLPSMRSLQFGGKAIELNNSRIYNCAFMCALESDFFSELMFLLLGGTGVGYSVQWRHVRQLPAIQRPGKARKYVVQDSIVGWADAVKRLIRAYLEGSYLPIFDYSDIRAAGTPLKTAGGKAPGPGPLRTCLAKICGILESKPVGSKLLPWEVSDLACIIADAVLAGGIRRSAMICLFDIDDDAMLGYKSGQWWELHPERGRVNVSAVAFREDVWDGGEGGGWIAKATTKEQFDEFWKYVEHSGSGEPGIYWSSHPDWGTNPCVEIALKHKQFCNLTTINFSVIKTQEDLNEAAYRAAVLGTLQAGYTDLHYLSEDWKQNCEDEALLGVSITGIADGNHYKGFNWKQAAVSALRGNEETAKAIGIKSAARVTCIKPEGTASLVLGTSSGIHARHSHYYLRRVRFGKDEAVAKFLMAKHPELVVQDLAKPDGVIIEIPQKAPDRSIYRTESPLELLERVKYFHKNWIMPGHRSGVNNHNVSCTVSIKADEWDKVGAWMWDNKDSYNGISVLPYDGGTYQQAPFEEITKEEYERRFEHLRNVDLSDIQENGDYTNLQGELACAGGTCEIA
jgi:ribonucleoside-triphosphate reductase